MFGSSFVFFLKAVLYRKEIKIVHLTRGHLQQMWVLLMEKQDLRLQKSWYMLRRQSAQTLPKQVCLPIHCAWLYRKRIKMLLVLVYGGYPGKPGKARPNDHWKKTVALLMLCNYVIISVLIADACENFVGVIDSTEHNNKYLAYTGWQWCHSVCRKLNATIVAALLRQCNVVNLYVLVCWIIYQSKCAACEKPWQKNC